MKFLNYLTEEYETTLNIFGVDVVVYINPTKQDLQDMKKDIRDNVMSLMTPDARRNIDDIDRFIKSYEYIRYIADLKNEKLYAWGGSLAIHQHIMMKLKLSRGLPYIKGETAVGKNGKLELFEVNKYSMIPYTNGTWLKKYFNKVSIQDY